MARASALAATISRAAGDDDLKPGDVVILKSARTMRDMTLARIVTEADGTKTAHVVYANYDGNRIGPFFREELPLAVLKRAPVMPSSAARDDAE